jgi:glucose/arabinose dehydrogenase
MTQREKYSGGLFGKGIRSKAGVEQPVYYLVPSTALSYMKFPNSDRYGQAWYASCLSVR